jgi:CheY-like chemotaxis protein
METCDPPTQELYLADPNVLNVEPLPLAGRRIMLVEDDYLVADDLAAHLREAGGEVIGPASSLPAAMRLACESERIDAALLDIDLNGVAVFPLAAELRARGVPLLFLTGFGMSSIPHEFIDIERCQKPVSGGHMIGQLWMLLRTSVD